MINDVCWATRNVDMPGVFVANPEDFGMFYQWGSDVGWSSTDPLTATDGMNTWRDLSESGNIWLPENNPCPEGWRAPTREEFESLVSANNYWGNLNGIDGRFFGNEEPRLFLPAAGHRNDSDGEFFGVGIAGYYWSSSIYGHYAYSLLIASTIVDPSNYTYRARGFNVRCVAEP
jgi:uncharacterized protein (TIGR02145 family)